MLGTIPGDRERERRRRRGRGSGEGEGEERRREREGERGRQSHFHGVSGPQDETQGTDNPPDIQRRVAVRGSRAEECIKKQLMEEALIFPVADNTPDGQPAEQMQGCRGEKGFGSTWG